MSVSRDLAALERAEVVAAARRLLELRRGGARPVTLGLLAWCRAMAPDLDWSSPHLSAVCARLEQVSSGTSRRLVLVAPPRHGKSTLVSVLYPVWRLERDPSLRVAVGSHSLQLATRLSRLARRLARRRGLALLEERRSALEWEVMGGGCYRACAVGAPPTGEGFGLVVIDDPLRGREEADSAAHRDRAHEWYRGDMVARLEPGGSVVLVAARWHQDDLSGRLLAAEAGWEVLRLSALAEEGDPLGRRPGEALWPARYPAEALERIRREEGDRYFGALYQGSPSWGEGGMFLAGRAPVLDGDAPLLPAYLGLDLAYGGRDWTAGALLLGPAPESPRWRVAWVRRCRHEPAARDEELRSWRALAEAVDPEVIVVLPVDPSAGAEVAGRIAADVLPGARVRSARQRGSKEARAERLAAAWNAGEVGVCRGPWLAALLDELAAFPSGAYDDQVDALAAAFEAAHAAGESVGAVVGVGGRGYAPIRRTFGGAIIGRRRR